MDEAIMTKTMPVGRFEDAILATISHELRTPLATIKGYTTTLLRQDRRLSRAERLDFLREIDIACDRQEQLIHRLLRLSHLAREIDPRDRSLVDLAELASAALEAARQQATPQSSSIYTFTLDLPTDPLPPLLIDAGKIREVFDHLLENAIKYAPQGGPIRLAIREWDRRSGDAAHHLAGNADEGVRYAEVTITDHGLGIPADQVETIFLPFHRADMRLTRDIGGLGIGLAFCRRVVEASGGALWAESVEGTGSTFHLALPLPPTDT